MNTLAEDIAFRDRILSEQLTILYDSIGSLVMINLVVSVALTFAFWEVANQNWLIAWMSAIVVMLSVRVALYVLFKRQSGTHNLGKYRAFLIVGSLSAGIIWGAGGLIMFVPGEIEYQLLILLSLLAMSSGSAFSLSIYLPAYFVFVPVMLAPITLQLFTLDDRIYAALGSVTVVFFVAQTIFNVKINRSLTNAMALRFENLALVGQLQAQKEEAERANSAKSRFLATASHDLRQPLYALTLFTSALDERVESTDIRSIVDRIKRSSESLRSLFDALLDISKLDAGTLNVEKQNFPLSRVLEKLAEEFNPRAAESGLWAIWPSVPFIVHSEPVLLEQILRNLISNAIYYTRSGGVTISCEQRGSCVQIDVADTGIGMTASEQAHVFDEFYKIDDQRSDGHRGMGLGLSIVERAAQQLGHQIEMNSEVGRGTTFSLVVDLASRDGIVETTVTPPVNEGNDTFGGDNRLLVVVIDDEQSIREGLTQLLELWECEVISCANQDEALAKIHACMRREERRPDGVITDFRLGHECTGLDAIEAINATFEMDLPALIITGDTGRTRLIELQSSGHEVLHKPVPPAKLRAFLRGLARHRASDVD